MDGGTWTTGCSPGGESTSGSYGPRDSRAAAGSGGGRGRLMGRVFLSSSSSDGVGSSSSRGFSIGGLGTGGSCAILEEKEEDDEPAAASRRRSCSEREVFGGLRGSRAGGGGERGWVCGWEEEEEQAWRVSLRRWSDMGGGGGSPAGWKATAHRSGGGNLGRGVGRILLQTVKRRLGY